MIYTCIVCNKQKNCSWTPVGFVCAPHYFDRPSLNASKPTFADGGEEIALRESV